MTKEEEFVVEPLQKFFLDRTRSGADWKILHRPSFGTAATGWDLQIERHNQVLLIEAKYIRGPFAASLAGLVISPLSNRPENRSSLYRSWSAVSCWAIGSGYSTVGKYKLRNVYQLLLDYFSRNLNFWKSYAETLRVKYIFFVEDGRVAKMTFEDMVKIAAVYKDEICKIVKKTPEAKRRIAGQLLADRLKFK